MLSPLHNPASTDVSRVNISLSTNGEFLMRSAFSQRFFNDSSIFLIVVSIASEYTMYYIKI